MSVLGLGMEVEVPDHRGVEEEEEEAADLESLGIAITITITTIATTMLPVIIGGVALEAALVKYRRPRVK